MAVLHPPYENDEASYGQVPKPKVYMGAVNLSTIGRELGGLYKLAVSRADAMEVAKAALTLLHKNSRLLSPGERERLAELGKQLNRAQNV